MATGEITGTALTEEGDVIENAKVWAVNQDTDAVYGPVTTDVNGDYVLDPPGGTYHVFAQAPDGSGGYLNSRSSPGVVVDSVLPDGDNLYADYNPDLQTDATEFTDQSVADRHLTANGDPTLVTDVFGTNKGIDLDGSGDYYSGTTAAFGTLTQPFTIYIVFTNDDQGSVERGLINDSTGNLEIRWDGRSGKKDWKFRGEDQFTFGSGNPLYNDIVSVWNGSDSLLAADGTIEVSGADMDVDTTIGSVELDGIDIGQRADDTRRWAGRIGRVLIYDGAHDADTRSAVRTYLSNGGWI